ncbi:Protein strawberry notch 1 [Amphibalanus amphitrite]|uniref:Protein strawberry notch 1 n=1 Tax=Amphibalanus amphitrite TaxID=1232801 RepID=A0A6A4VB31_AMPAM|nr:Protein strawberry notch 1 [Amphibalanus amphitrite]
MTMKYAKINSVVNGDVKKGVVYSTYSSLIGESSTVGGKYKTRLKQLVHWCGDDFDGLRKDGCDRLGSIVRCDRMWDGALEVEFRKSEEATNALSATRFVYSEGRASGRKLVSLPLMVEPQRSKNSSRGVINCFDLRNIVFDECHRAKNLCPVGSSKPTKTGLTVLELQKQLPKARVVYASATGASEPKNMAYMVRLGIWGAGTPFREFSDFISAVEKR